MASNLSDKTFLVVDDFADMRSVMRSLLRSLEVTRIDLAANGNEAISRMEKKHYDVVLCDYNLGPGKDGQQVLEEARHRQLLGLDSIFIMVTAESAREMVMAAVEYTPDSYLTKPFTAELLQTRLEKLFEKKAHLTEVNRAMLAKNYSAAIDELNLLISETPKNLSELLKLKAEICITAGHYDEALAIYQKILDEREVTWARLGLGKVFFHKKQYTEAERIFRELINVDRNLLEAYDWLAKTQMALERFQEAEKTLDAAIKISPRGLKRQCALGEIALANGNTERAEVAFNKAVNLAKHSVLNHPSLMAGLAKSLTANGKHDLALEIANKIERDFPHHEQTGFYQATALAIVKNNLGDKQGAEKALKAAEQALKDAGGAVSPTMSLEMVKAYAALGDHQKATALLESAVANNHDDENFLASVKQVCQSAGFTAESEAVLKEIQQEVVRTNNKGVRLIQMGQYDAAIALLRKAAEDMPANKTINLNAAKALIMKMEQHGPTEAELQQVRVYIDRVQRAAPDDWRLAEVSASLQRLAHRI